MRLLISVHNSSDAFSLAVNLYFADACGNEVAFALVERIYNTVHFHFAVFGIENEERNEALVINVENSYIFRIGNILAGSEVFAGTEKFGAVFVVLDGISDLIHFGGIADLDYFDRLFGVKLAEASVCLTSVVVIYTVGDVGVLLDFRNEDTRADCMNLTGGNEVNFAGMNVNGVEHIFGLAVGYSSSKIFDGASFLETVNELCAGFTCHNVPHFGLAEFTFVCEGVFVIGVNLNGKAVSGVDELDEKREAVVLGAVGAENGLVLSDELAERYAGIFAVCDYAGVITANGKFP